MGRTRNAIIGKAHALGLPAKAPSRATHQARKREPMPPLPPLPPEYQAVLEARERRERVR